MAIHTYRYERTIIGFDTLSLRDTVDSSASVYATGNQAKVDIQLEETKLDRLDEFMRGAGYTRIATDPVDPLL